MKKQRILLVICLCFTIARAQDTVHWGDPGYVFQYGCDHSSLDTVWGNCGVLNWPNSSEVSHSFVVDSATTIYGIAITIERSKLDGVLKDHSDGFNVDSYLFVYQQTKQELGYEMLDSIVVSLAEWEEALRHAKHYEWTHIFVDSSNGILPELGDYYRDTTYRVDTLVEIYLDHPIVLSDTFYVVCPAVDGNWNGFGFSDRSLLAAAKRVYFENHCFNSSRTLRRPINGMYPDAPRVFYMTVSNPACPIRQGVLPITRKPEPSMADCVTPQSPTLSYLSVENDLVQVVSDPTPAGYLRQMALGRYPGDPDTCLTSTRSGIRFYEYRQLDTGYYYAVWQRNQCGLHFTCNTDTTWWTDWSEPLIFYYGTEPDTTGTSSDTTSTDTTGISLPLAPAFTFSPNPTTGEVTVEVADWTPGMTLELLDLQGRLLHHYTLHTTHCTLDLSPYPVGTYLLRLTTPTGTTTQRLVKQ